MFGMKVYEKRLTPRSHKEQTGSQVKVKGTINSISFKNPVKSISVLKTYSNWAWWPRTLWVGLGHLRKVAEKA